MRNRDSCPFCGGQASSLSIESMKKINDDHERRKVKCLECKKSFYVDCTANEYVVAKYKNDPDKTENFRAWYTLFDSEDYFKAFGDLEEAYGTLAGGFPKSSMSAARRALEFLVKKISEGVEEDKGHGRDLVDQITELFKADIFNGVDMNLALLILDRADYFGAHATINEQNNVKDEEMNLVLDALTMLFEKFLIVNQKEQLIFSHCKNKFKRFSWHL